MSYEGKEFHAAACFFPLMEGGELESLAKDIREHGLDKPAELLDGRIIDGRNRVTACWLAGVEPRFVEAPERAKADPVAYVMSCNDHRRHLTDSQRSLAAGKARDYYDKQAKERQTRKPADSVVENLPQQKGRARDKAGEVFGVSGKSVDYGTTVARRGIPELVEAVEKGQVAISTAARAVKTGVDEQKRIAAGGKARATAVVSLKGKSLASATLSQKALAASADISSGVRSSTVLAHYGIQQQVYKRAKRVAESGNGALIAAMNEGLLQPSAADKLVKQSPDKIDAAIEKARETELAKTHRKPSTTGKTKAERLLDLLGETWSGWSAASHNIPINSKSMPAGEEKLNELLRLCGAVRKYVTGLLEKIEVEAQGCLRKIVEKRTS